MKIKELNSIIIVPWDFSELSRDALNRAYDMVTDPNQIRVVHVSQLPSPYEIGIAWEAVSEQTIRDQLVIAFRKELENDPRLHNINLTVLFGDPGRAICNYALDHGAELIVVPSHGRSGFTRLLLGSVAERIVRHAPCPVLVIRTPAPVEDPEFSGQKPSSVTVY